MCTIEGEAYHSCQDEVHSRMPVLRPAEVRLASSLYALIVHNVPSLHRDVGFLTEIRSRTHSQLIVQSKTLLQLLRTWCKYLRSRQGLHDMELPLSYVQGGQVQKQSREEEVTQGAL